MQKKTKLKRRPKEPRSLSTHTKLAVLLVAGIIILIADAFYSVSPPPEAKKTARSSQDKPIIDTKAVLGTFDSQKKQLQSLIEENFTFFKQVAPSVSQDIATTAGSLFDENVPTIESVVGRNVESVVNENALKPLVKQIENLPESQQKVIREVICTAPTAVPTKSE